MPGKSKGDIYQYRNCRLLRNHILIKDDLWVQNGKIIDPEKLFFDTRIGCNVKIDCHNAIISPGFIEVQINGAYGVDFSFVNDDISKGIEKVAKGLLSHGITSFCPTIITSPPEDYAKLLPHFRKTKGSKNGAGILGLHIEGPYINKEKKGAHPEQFICSLDKGMQDMLAMYGNLDEVALLTLAPELNGSGDVIKQLTDRGITVSLGHSMATLSEGEEAVRQGASFITHLFNAMLPFHHRDPHLVGLLASNEIPAGRNIFFGIISDGIHTHESALRIAYRTHPKGLVLVTDAIPAMGLEEGLHHLGHQAIEIKDGQAVIAGTNTLCGSIATMNQCVQFFLKATRCSLVQALEVATLHPAQLLGITDVKGTLDYNSDADFLLLDDDLNVRSTYIGGDCVWQSDKGHGVKVTRVE